MKTNSQLLQENSDLRQRIKELENSENELYKSREMLQLILDTIQQGVFWKDTNFNYLGCNEKFAKDASHNNSYDIIDKNDFDLFLEEIGNLYREDDKQVMDNDSPKLDFEEYIIHSDGTKLWLKTSKVPLHDKNGNVIGIMGTYEDITERKKIEENLRREKILLRTLIDNLPDAIFVKDLESRKTVANLADVHNMGLNSEADVLGKNDFELFSKEIAENFFADDQAVIKDGKTILNREEFFIDNEGKKAWLLTTKLPFRDDNGNIIGLIGIGRNITKQKLFEEALQNERKFLKTLIDNIPDFIYFKDNQGKYILNNKAHLHSMGVESQEEVIGKTTFDFHPKELAEVYFNDEMQIIQSGIPMLYKEEIAFHKDTNENDWHLTSKIPLWKDGMISGIVCVSRNITQQKMAQEALRQTYEELEQTNQDLEKANKIKGQFLANMSHEIRTPLNAVIGLTGLLLDTPLNNEQRDFVETILNSGDILLTLINDILDFSKIEAQKIELEKQPFDVRNCIEESLDLVASKASEKNLELAYSIDSGLPTWVIGDVTRFRQIMVNLLSNAIKFTEKGEVVVGVEGQLQDNYSYMLHFSVRDTGIGLPADRRDRLFKSFTQVDSSTTRKYGGTGLGLAISKQLSELMGGTMWVESTGISGEGSTFHFTILTELSIEKEIWTDLPTLSGRRVLIVDDNKTNRNILTQQAASLHMLPTCVRSGEEAIELLKTDDKFDLAILDYQMPTMDGVMLAEEIKKIPERKQLPLILLSSYGFREKNMNFTFFAATLTKPIKFSQLHNALVAVLSKNKVPVKKHRDISSMQFDSSIGKQYPLKILLAEDNNVNQKVALKFLEKLGYRADVAFNGLEVLDALNRQYYDIILMDIQMPDMDGEEATIEIRRSFLPNHQPRIIAMTANALKSDRDKYITSGMDDYIIKPFKIEELVRALIESYTYLHPIKISNQDKENFRTANIDVNAS